MARPRKWTRETAIQAIKAYASRHGEAPAITDCRAWNGLPDQKFIYGTFGTMAHYATAAGLEPNTRKQHEGVRRWQEAGRREMQRLWRRSRRGRTLVSTE